jgi:Ca2+/H+ antiporter, TMEM165/GDT1 family
VLEAFLVAFAVIFVAEFADKSQLVAFGFATRYRAVTVIAVLLVANTLTQGVTVLVGAGIGHLLPDEVASVAAGLVMFAFAVWGGGRPGPPRPAPAATSESWAGSRPPTTR